MKPPSFRRLFVFLGKLSLVGGMLVGGLVLLLPFYLGWVLPRFLPEGLSYESYERLDYRHFALSEVVYEQAGVSVRVQGVKALMPLSWLWRSWSDKHEGHIVEASLVEVSVAAQTDQKAAGEPWSWSRTLSGVDRGLEQVDYWLPMASVDRLVLVLNGERVEIDSLEWKERQLEGQVMLPERSKESANVSLALEAGHCEAGLDIDAWGLSAEGGLQWAETAPRLDVRADWEGNHMAATAEFSDGAWLPKNAEWKASEVSLDAGSLGEDFPYKKLFFDWSGFWSDEGFQNDLAGHVEAGEEASTLPHVVFACRVSGDLESFRLDEISLDAPGVHAELEKSVVFHYEKMELSDRLSFVVNGDLSALKMDQVSGAFEGLLTLDSKGDQGLSGQFQAKAQDVELKDFRLDELDMAGALDGRQLSLNTLQARLGGDSRVEGRMDVDLETKVIRESHFDLDLKSGFLGAYLPEAYQLDEFSAELELQGELGDLRHRLEAEVVGFESQDLKPMKLSLSSEGRLMNAGLVELQAEVATGELLEGAVDYSLLDGKWRGTIRMLSLDGPEGLGMQLEQSATLWFSLGAVPEFQLDDLRLSGGESALEAGVQWLSVEKGLRFSASGLDLPLWANAWTKHEVANILIRDVSGEAHLEDGLWRAALDADAVVRQGEEQIGLLGEIQANANGLTVTNLELADERHTWVSVKGHLPLLMGPVFEAYYQMDTAAPMELEVQTENHQAWIDLINPVLPVALNRFNASIQLRGSLSQPEGVVRMRLATQGGEGEQAMPSVQAEVDGVLQGNLLALDQLRMVVKDQEFSARGEVRFPDNTVAYLEDRSIEIDWKQTAFDFSVDDSSLVPLAYFLNGYIRPNGMLDAKLHGDLDNGFDGEVHLSGLSSKAVFPFGSFRDVSADLVFNDSRAELQSFVGKIGREPVEVKGSVDYHDIHNPAYHLTLAGEDLPLVRQAGILLRADLDLRVEGDRNDGVLVDGRIGLKDGLYMLNLADLASGNGGQSAESNPPYFSVEEKPFNAWKLNVDIEGERFMSLYTPALEAVVSMNMKLLGTLQEPFLNGEIHIDEGAVLFPFAQFDIDQGSVVFPVGDPYSPKLDVQASCQRLDYDLLLLAKGDAFDPELIFDSNPPMTSEQVLMLVVAGVNPEDTLEYEGATQASRIGTYMTMGLWGSGPSSSGIGSRFSMNSGSSLSRQGKETMQMEFMLDEDWYLVGEYDEYDAWNGGVRWRILNPVKKRREEEPQGEE